MATLYWIGGEGYWEDASHWSLSSGGPSGSTTPTIDDDVIFDSNSTSVDMNVSFSGSCERCKSLNCTDVMNKVIFNIEMYLIINGDITLNSNIIFKIHNDTNYENIFNGIINKGICISNDCNITSDGVQLPTICLSDRISSNTFIFQIDTDLGGGGFASFILPLTSSGTYDFDVYWGDGSSNHITQYNDQNITHIYDAGGIYTICINGVLKGWSTYVTYESPNNNNDMITNIIQWGCFDFDNDNDYVYIPEVPVG